MDNVDYPTQPIPQPILDLLARFYHLLDSPASDSSRELAEEVFTPKGTWVVNKRVMRGPSEILRYRTGSETVTPRRHFVDKIYVCNEQGDDLLMTGTFKQVGGGGTADARGSYCARCVVDDCESESPRIEYWQIWVDNPPFAAATPRREKTPGSGVLDTIGGR